MKNKLKKLALTASLGALCTSYAFAEQVVTEKYNVQSDLEVKLNGYAHFQTGYRNQSNLNSFNSTKNEKNVSQNRKDFAFFNESAFLATVSKQADELTYGTRIVLVPTSKRKGSPSYNGSHIFLESSYGRVEMGSPISAGSNMFIDASLITAATGGNWDRYADFTLDNMRQSNKIKGQVIDGVVFDGNQQSASFATFADFFLDSKLVAKLDDRVFSSEPSRSISYYTPNFELSELTKVQLGVSYIPDSSNTGAENPDKASSGTSNIKLNLDGKEGFDMDTSVKDTFTGGLTVEQAITDGVDLKVAFTGEYGKSAGQAKRRSVNPNINGKIYKLSDLRTYNIGAILNVGNFSYGASYGSLGKSLTTAEVHKTGRETNYYTGAVTYKFGPFSTSVSYFKSEQFKNTADAVGVGADVKLYPGLLPYVEAFNYVLKGKPEFYPQLERKKSRGTVGLIGLKLSL